MYCTEGDSRLVDITVGDDFLGLCDQKGLYQYVSLVMNVCNCHKHPPVNHASHFTLHNLKPAGTGTLGERCNLQLVLSGCVSCGIFKNLFKVWVSVN